MIQLGENQPRLPEDDLVVESKFKCGDFLITGLTVGIVGLRSAKVYVPKEWDTFCFYPSTFRRVSYLSGMNKFVYTVIALIAFSCNKTPLLEALEAMVGSWIHYSSEVDAHRIKINEDGTGSIEFLKDGEAIRATKIRDWYLDDNILAFGKAAFNGESYEIDEYPAVAWEELINYYDTIPELSRFIVLDDNYYAEE